MYEDLEETGEVVETAEESAKVLLKRHDACEKCGACEMGDRPELLVEVDNTIGAKKGDKVVLRMQAGHLFKAAFLMYTIPLLMLIIGFLVGQKLAMVSGADISLSENIGIFIGFIFLILTYIGIRWWDRRKQIGKRVRPQLVRIIGPVPDSSSLQQKSE